MSLFDFPAMVSEPFSPFANIPPYARTLSGAGISPSSSVELGALGQPGTPPFY
jgi:hypothetical protein